MVPLSRWNAGSSISSISVSHDATRIAACSDGLHFHVWDVQTGDLLLGPLEGHTGWVSTVAFSFNDIVIASGSTDETIRLWDVHTGAPIGIPLEGHSGTIQSVAFSPDSSRIVSGSSDTTIRIWDASTGTLVGEPLRGHRYEVFSVEFSPDGSRIVSGSNDETIRIWDVRTGTPIGDPLRGHSNSVSSVAFSPDSSRIVSGSWDRTIRIWDASTGTPVGEPLRGHTGDIYSVSFSPDNTLIVSGSSDAIRTWDARTGTLIGKLLDEHVKTVTWVAFSPDSACIISASSDSTIAVWEVPQKTASLDSAVSSVLPQQSPTTIVDNTFYSEEIRQNVPSFDMVSSKMSAQEIFDCLVRHGCTDLTSSIDFNSISSTAIASGGFGDVWRAALNHGVLVAIKTLRLHILLEGGDKGMKRAAREVYVWSKLQHPNVQQLLGIVLFQGGLGMVSPWMEQGNLRKYIEKHPHVERYPLCVQLVSGVSYLHNIEMVHGDIKANNVLVSDYGMLKINDFDHAILSDTTLQFSATTRTGGGTLRWMAPELLKPTGMNEEEEAEATAARNKQTDVYALAMTMLEIITGTVPYSEYRNDWGIYQAIHTKRPPRRPNELPGTDGRAAQMWELLLQCWDHDPWVRPDASTVLESLQSFAVGTIYMT